MGVLVLLCIRYTYLISRAFSFLIQRNRSIRSFSKK